MLQPSSSIVSHHRSGSRDPPSLEMFHEGVVVCYDFVGAVPGIASTKKKVARLGSQTGIGIGGATPWFQFQKRPHRVSGKNIRRLGSVDGIQHAQDFPISEQVATKSGVVAV